MDDLDPIIPPKNAFNNSVRIKLSLIKVLACIRNIIGRDFFSTHYIKEDLLDELHTMVDDSVIKREDLSVELHTLLGGSDIKCEGVSFPPLEKGAGSTIEKRDVYSIIQNANLGLSIEQCMKATTSFHRIIINNFGSHYEGYMLLDMSEKIVQYTLSFESTNLFRMDKIEGCLADFVVFLLRKIAGANMNSFTQGNGNFIHLLTQLVLKYTRLPFIQPIILEEIAAFLTKFITFYNMKKIRHPEDLHFETLSVLLSILFEVLHSTNMGAPVEFEQIRKGCSEDLCHALRALQGFLPENFGSYIDRSIDSLSTAITF